MNLKKDMTNSPTDVGLDKLLPAAILSAAQRDYSLLKTISTAENFLQKAQSSPYYDLIKAWHETRIQ